jgi:hypothetical protein
MPKPTIPTAPIIRILLAGLAVTAQMLTIGACSTAKNASTGTASSASTGTNDLHNDGDHDDDDERSSTSATPAPPTSSC